MKKTLLFAAAALGLMHAQSCATEVTLNLDAGQLLTSGSVAIPDGCLIQLLGDPSTTFGAPTASSFTGADPNEVVLASFAMNSSSVGTAGDFLEPIVLTLTGDGVPPDKGSDLLLRWYPTITYASYNASIGPEAGTSYGQFRTDAVEDGSDIAWVLPGSGTVALNFLTVSQPNGTEPNSAGIAGMTVANVPEPGAFSLMGVALGIGGVALRRRHQGEPMADILLVPGVNIQALSDVDGYGQSGIRDLGGRDRLCLAQFRPTARGRLRGSLAVIGELHDEEREIAFIPAVPPILDQRRQQPAVLVSPVGVGLALIPNHATHGVRPRQHCCARLIGSPLACHWKSPISFTARMKSGGGEEPSAAA
jgi:hypothetical protein